MEQEPLPPALGQLWARIDSPSPEPRTGLSLDRIARAAVTLADEGGLEAVSMARVAQQLGYTTMALYRHVRNKHELLLIMLDSVAGVPEEVSEPSAPGDWRLELRRWCRAQWEMLRAHAWIVHLPITGPPVTPNQLAWTDRGLAALRDTGLSEADKVGAVLLVANYMHTTARLSAQLGPAASGQAIAAYSTLLGTLVSAERFPALHTAVGAGAFDYPPGTPHEERGFDYAFGLDRILDGIDSLIRTRESGSPA